MALSESEIERILRSVPEDVVGICRRLEEKGKRGWIVGGCVRDLLLGRKVTDWDVATDARPEEVQRIFRKVIPTGIKHGTVTVVMRGKHYEVTTLRGEGAYHDGRRPAEVVFLDDIVDDLARRDFTFNAMALDLKERLLIDPFGGQHDLAARLVRAVGDPFDRFAEDGLRVLRAARFAAVLDCAVEERTRIAMGDARVLATYAKVSAERIHDEWMKTMRARLPSIAFELMRERGILAITCPELLEGVGCEQNRWHAFDVWTHTMAVLDACPPDPVLRLAALLHDVAKPRTRELSPKTNDYTFYHHEALGADMAGDILRRLRASTATRERVVHLVRHHLICYQREWTDAAVRRWLRRVTPERMDDLLALGRADAEGKGRPVDEELELLDDLRERADALLRAGTALSPRDLALDGKQLMAELRLSPGPMVGTILRQLVELCTDEPEANERGRLLAEARRMLEEAEKR